MSHSRFGWLSRNWAGYARAGRNGQFKEVAGSWIVPAVAPSPTPTFSSTWIGVDGFQNQFLLQTGTEHDYFNGASHYYAWWEILPHMERRIRAFRVHPGDRIFARLRRMSKRKWSISLRNITTGRRFLTIQPYSGPQSSVEWIFEAPTVNGKIAAMAKFGSVTFERCTVNRRPPAFSLNEAGILVMNGRSIAVPTRPNASSNGFSVRCR